jgi:hypothetical protein
MNNHYICENPGCEKFFENDLEWENANEKRSDGEKRLKKPLFIYCDTCVLAEEDVVEFTFDFFRFISEK